MTCQCYQIGGPFIAEDPDCVVHGSAATSRERQLEELRTEAQNTTDVHVPHRIVDDVISIATNLNG